MVNIQAKFTSSYWIGFAFAFCFAIISAVFSALPCIFNDVAVSVYMFWGGIGSALVAFVLPLAGSLIPDLSNLKMSILDPTSISEYSRHI